MVRDTSHEIRFASGAVAVRLFVGIVLLVYEIEAATVRMVAGSVCLSVAPLDARGRVEGRHSVPGMLPCVRIESGGSGTSVATARR
jgi:hypothetical protein